MTMFFLITLLIISIIFSIASIILVKRLLKKINTYEKYIIDFRNNLVGTLDKMREIDKTGVFSSRVNQDGVFEHDDLTGGIFKELLGLIEELNKIIVDDYKED